MEMHWGKTGVSKNKKKKTPGPLGVKQAMGIQSPRTTEMFGDDSVFIWV